MASFLPNAWKPMTWSLLRSTVIALVSLIISWLHLITGVVEVDILDFTPFLCRNRHINQWICSSTMEQGVALEWLFFGCPQLIFSSAGRFILLLKSKIVFSTTGFICQCNYRGANPDRPWFKLRELLLLDFTSSSVWNLNNVWYWIHIRSNLFKM